MPCRTRLIQPIVCAVAAWLLSACGGEGRPAPVAQAVPAAAATGNVSADDLLDWAERRYPELFPQGSISLPLEHAGRSWQVRTYEGAWGRRHLGVDADGGVAGLGDFTDQVLKEYGRVGDYAAQVQPDNCADHPLADGCPAAPVGRRLALGGGRVLAIDGRGHVLVWGDGIQTLGGRLGGTALPGSRALDTGVVARAVGIHGARLMAVTPDGQVLAWGELLDGERGEPYDARAPRSTYRTVPLPMPMLQPGRVVQVESDAVLRQDGSVWIHPGRRVPAAGGLEQILPVRLSGLPAIGSIMRGYQMDPAGPSSVLMVGLDGSRWLAQFSRYDDLAPAIRPLEPLRLEGAPALAQIECAHGCALVGRDGSLWIDPRYVGGPPRQVAGLAGVVQVAQGRDDGVALTADGRVWAWSHRVEVDARQELVFTSAVRRIDGLDDVVEVAAGGYDGITYLARRRDGSLWGWGANDRGQLAGGSEAALQDTPVRLPGIAL